MARRALLALVLLAGCRSTQVTETRMIVAPAREAQCTLALVSANIADPMFMQTWDVLGYVTLTDAESPDPAAEVNKRLVRGRACAMGGTTIGVATAASTNDRASVAYMVLRPKQQSTGAGTF